MERTNTTLTPTRVFWFYLPLAAMWLTMGVEQPVITAFIARLADAKEGLAAFGIAFTMGLLVEGPVIMLLTAGTALAHTRVNYRRLLDFTHILAVGLTVVHVIIGFTPLYRLILTHLIKAPEVIVWPSNVAFVAMTPWTAAIAYRRLWQGVLIRFKRTVVVPIAMIARLVAVGGVMGVGFAMDTPGPMLGAIALSVGVIASAVTTYGFARGVIRRMPEGEAGTDKDEHPLNWHYLISFYVPLALTSLLTLGRRPLLAAGIGHAPEKLSSLAVWPVIGSVLFVFGSMAIAAQEVIVALRTEEESFPALQRFTRRLSVALAGMLGVFAFTPLSHYWFVHVAGLSVEMAEFARVPMMLVFVGPGLETLLSWNRGLLVHENRTRAITWGVVLNIAVLVTVLSGGIYLTALTGAIVAALARSTSMVAEAAFLWGARREGSSES